MRMHHTKDKGDLEVAKAYADLVEKGYLVLLPATEHAPFDVVAYGEGRFVGVQVKFRHARPDGTISVEFKSSRSDRNGAHQRGMDKSEVDVVCVYCPTTGLCYYLCPQAFGNSITLRLSPTRNGQVVGVSMAEDFRDMPSNLA